MTKYLWMILWILLPFVYGYISNTLTFMLYIPTVVIQVLFGIFWFWVGMKFSRINGNTVKNFLIGNSVWLLSFILFLWQFVILDDGSRNKFFALVSQYCIIPFIWSGTHLSMLFGNDIYSTTIIMFAFLSMLVVFTAGFIVGKRIS